MIKKVCPLALALLLISAAEADAKGFFKIFKRNKKQNIEMVVEPAQQAAPTTVTTPIDTTSQPIVDTTTQHTTFEEETPILNTEISTAEYDSLIAIWHSRGSEENMEAYFNDFINIDSASTIATQIPDSVFERRLRSILSPIQLPYNDIVKRYIIAYTTSRKSTMERIIALSRYYFPIFEEALDREQMPLELRMLPAIESALRPEARSRVGATGLWQFMFVTGRQFGLEITSLVDARRDPLLSTNAACKYLKSLYNIYNDWSLAIASYNCGPGNVNKAIRRAGGGKTFWDIYPYLPRETRGYIPSFIAATYAYTYYREHNLNPDMTVDLPNIATDTVMIDRPTHFSQISSTIDVPLEVLRSLNPQYTKDIVPAIDGKNYPLIIPVSQMTSYIDSLQAIHAKDSTYLGEYIFPSNIKKGSQTMVYRTHKIRSGDTLGKIARKYGVSTTSLAKHNNMKTTSILRVGRVLKIPMR